MRRSTYAISNLLISILTFTFDTVITNVVWFANSFTCSNWLQTSIHLVPDLSNSYFKLICTFGCYIGDIISLLYCSIWVLVILEWSLFFGENSPLTWICSTYPRAVMTDIKRTRVTFIFGFWFNGHNTFS